eukprot:6279486-Alexandrium_andersonii.AAC.1
MSASLVGSEMCIRDRPSSVHGAALASEARVAPTQLELGFGSSRGAKGGSRSDRGDRGDRGGSEKGEKKRARSR